ncbi:hypothetical protein LZC95_29740 [Pendulispora brunnea]|uniref:Peptidase inhibitor family I36 n=1 Tax=Pendulispora brunnea TaxID=2905690 RepID=A0ABZ2JZV7_9BACT
MQQLTKMLTAGGVCALALVAMSAVSVTEAKGATEEQGQAADQGDPSDQGDQSELACATAHGCPCGYGCIYPEDAGWNNDRPSHKYYKYACYNLSNQYGTHRLFNNQTGRALMIFYGKYNCIDPYGWLEPGQWFDRDLGPINSVALTSG